MLKKFKKQFIVPRGILGTLAGKIMFLENKKINTWTLNQLDINPGNHILEIGFGPGYAIQEIMDAHPYVSVEGIDLSHEMKAAAEKRNEEYIELGRVKLSEGDVSSLGGSRETYDRVFTVNNYPLWDEPAETLKSLFPLFKKTGKIAITVQPREEGADDATARQLGAALEDDLKNAGFVNINVSFLKVRPVLAVCATAERPA